MKFDLFNLNVFNYIHFEWRWLCCNNINNMLDFEYSFEGKFNDFVTHLKSYFDLDFINDMLNECVYFGYYADDCHIIHMVEFSSIDELYNYLDDYEDCYILYLSE